MAKEVEIDNKKYDSKRIKNINTIANKITAKEYMSRYFLAFESSRFL